MANKMKVLTAGVKSSNKKSKKKKSSNNNTKQQQQSHSTTTNDTANNNDIESAAAAVESSTNTVDNRLNTPNNDNINGGHSIVGKFFSYLYINVWLFLCVCSTETVRML